MLWPGIRGNVNDCDDYDGDAGGGGVNDNDGDHDGGGDVGDDDDGDDVEPYGKILACICYLKFEVK